MAPGVISQDPSKQERGPSGGVQIPPDLKLDSCKQDPKLSKRVGVEVGGG